MDSRKIMAFIIVDNEKRLKKLDRELRKEKKRVHIQIV